MNKKAIFAMTVAVLVTACIVMSTAGIAAADVRQSAAEPSDEIKAVATNLTAKLAEAGATVDENNVAKILQMMESRQESRQGTAQGTALDIAAVEDVIIVNHEASANAWDVRVINPGILEFHWFPPSTVPDTYTYGGLLWDDGDNDLDLYLLTAGGFDWSWYTDPLVESVGPVRTRSFGGFNAGAFVVVHHWGGISPNPTAYVLGLDSHWSPWL